MCDTSMLEEKRNGSISEPIYRLSLSGKMEGSRRLVGHGNPMFAVDIRETIPMKKLMDSTSLALGEAYMKGASWRWRESV